MCARVRVSAKTLFHVKRKREVGLFEGLSLVVRGRESAPEIDAGEIGLFEGLLASVLWREKCSGDHC